MIFRTGWICQNESAKTKDEERVIVIAKTILWPISSWKRMKMKIIFNVPSRLDSGNFTKSEENFGVKSRNVIFVDVNNCTMCSFYLLIKSHFKLWSPICVWQLRKRWNYEEIKLVMWKRIWPGAGWDTDSWRTPGIRNEPSGMKIDKGNWSIIRRAFQCSRSLMTCLLSNVTAMNWRSGITEFVLKVLVSRKLKLN